MGPLLYVCVLGKAKISQARLKSWRRGMLTFKYPSEPSALYLGNWHDCSNSLYKTHDSQSRMFEMRRINMFVQSGLVLLNLCHRFRHKRNLVIIPCCKYYGIYLLNCPIIKLYPVVGKFEDIRFDFEISGHYSNRKLVVYGWMGF